MTRYNKELRKRGVRLDNDYPYLPYKDLDNVCSYYSDDSKALVVIEFYFQLTVKTYFGRDMSIVQQIIT